jgi:hypothetical protein
MHPFTDKLDGALAKTHTILSFALKRRRRGKIAALPDSVREQINLMLCDGLSYDEIISKLGEAGKGLNKDNLSRWRKADYQDWLEDQRWAAVRTKNPQLQTPNSVRTVAKILHECDDEVLRRTLSRDPAKCAALFKALARVAETTCFLETDVAEPAVKSKQI